ncbi:MAG: biotin/lipoyl-binding protein, partial [Aquificae bacterium]|nr:biotin/lipoyl-binding protein [Aquificota bacterium]
MRKLGVVLMLVMLVVGGLWAVKWVKFRLTHVISNAVFVESETFVKLGFKNVGGRVERTFKEEGQFVRKGELLAQLDKKDYLVKLKAVEHEMEALKRRLEALRLKKERLERETRLQ